MQSIEIRHNPELPKNIRKYLLENPDNKYEMIDKITLEQIKRKELLLEFSKEDRGVFLVKTEPGIGTLGILQNIYSEYVNNFVLMDQIIMIDDEMRKDFICVDKIGAQVNIPKADLVSILHKYGFKKIIILDKLK